jgi:hypothetical protein
MPFVDRRGLAWLLALPLMTAGSLTAHGLAYRLAVPDPAVRAQLLRGSGHGYLAAAPFVLGICLALVLAGIAAYAARAARGAPAGRAASWPLALLPLLGFAFQEHLERLLAGQAALDLASDPVFLVGLALQLPFALLALAAARAFGRAAETLGRALAPGRPQRLRPRPEAVRPGTEIVIGPRPPLALARSERGPPR